jgi:hypothetical protein
MEASEMQLFTYESKLMRLLLTTSQGLKCLKKNCPASRAINKITKKSDCLRNQPLLGNTPLGAYATKFHSLSTVAGASPTPAMAKVKTS